MSSNSNQARAGFSLPFRLITLLLGFVSTLILSGLVLLLVISALATPLAELNTEIHPLLNTWVMTVVMAMLILPGLIFTINEALKGKTSQPQEATSSRMLLPNLLLLVWLVLMVFAYFLTENLPAQAAWLLPVLQVPAVLIPIYWFFQLSARRLHLHKTRNWNLLGLNLSLQPVIVITIEVIALVLVLVALFAWVGGQPGMLERLQYQIEQLTTINFNIESFERIILPYLQQPFVLFIILFYIAGLVPLIEEFLKPMFLWRWVKAPLPPSQGFLLGLIGGSAFALWENFSALSSIGADSWFFVTIARYGTAILHMATTALLGWAMMKGFQDRNLLRTALVYFWVVFMHGAWNFFTILEAFSEINVPTATFPLNLAPLTPYVLSALVLFCLLTLIIGGGLIYNDEKKAASNGIQPAAESQPLESAS